MGTSQRRRLVIASVSLLAAPLVRAQQSGRTYVVGTLIPPVTVDVYSRVLNEQLATHGFIQGRNLRIERGVVGGGGVGPGSGREATQMLLAKKVDAIFSCFDGVTTGASWATKTVPIVFAWVGDPVQLGIVASLAHPGGNVTGVTNRRNEVSLKRFELALELVPNAKRVALLDVDYWPDYAKAVRPILLKVARRSKLELLELNAIGSLAVEDAHKAGADVVVTNANQWLAGFRGILEGWVKSSIERRLPVVFAGREEVEAGALISYGTNASDDVRRAADLIARVLKGEKPGDLPVDQDSRFELVLNLKTAKAIGLTIPQSILLRADRVIE